MNTECTHNLLAAWAAPLEVELLDLGVWWRFRPRREGLLKDGGGCSEGPERKGPDGLEVRE